MSGSCFLACSSCLNEALTRAHKCPTCRKAATADKLQRNAFLANEIAGKRVKCPNGCNARPFYAGKEFANLEKHKLRCPMEPVECR